MATRPFTPNEIAQAVPHLSPGAALELKAILFEQRCAGYEESQHIGYEPTSSSEVTEEEPDVKVA